MKPFWQSRTMWVNIVAAIASGSAALGVDLGMTAEVQTSIVVGVMAVVNIILRAVTTQPVSMK